MLSKSQIIFLVIVGSIMLLIYVGLAEDDGQDVELPAYVIKFADHNIFAMVIIAKWAALSIYKHQSNYYCHCSVFIYQTSILSSISTHCIVDGHQKWAKAFSKGMDLENNQDLDVLWIIYKFVDSNDLSN